MNLFDLTGFLIHKTDMKLTNYFIRKLKPYKVTPEQWGIISVLDCDRAMTQKEVAEAIDRDQSTVVRMIASLEKKGMVRRLQNDHDKRSHNLFLSAKGMQLKTSLLPVVKEAHDFLTRNLNQDELALLHETLHKLYLNVEGE
ncbi:MarR family winged helix-turn-helix transcriptional regulator [Paenibacillus sp. BC26]|uniref:MarR family winged helix-turn-helix transcriptional regulator n=1 Tax=Paenibacillus sp. BC26 TaxID=1881032 RepID=UPI0008EB1874|nr:MarR family transcriptional regulator [Paenibacillus sp. BC26]SFS72715.1 transcriptional regulator, MarR family [Paenibacillus sp. BC26]